MTTWYTADHHFGHTNVIKYASRPFASVEEMDQELIRRWNSRVGQDDRVFHLGDFTLRGYSDAIKYFIQLKGNITVLGYFGHHDRRWLKGIFQLDGEYRPMLSASGHPIDISLPIVETMLPNKRAITMSHYPLYTWHAANHGAINLHGHSHGNFVPPVDDRTWVDVGVDVWDYYPITLDDILTKVKERE